MSNDELEGEQLPKRLALPIFASDALSSVAYATEAALVVLVTVSSASRGMIIPLSAAVAMLLTIVVLSYRQTIQEYPGGGGGYVVARDNLGDLSGLVAAASLLVDYVLTVAVSVVAGAVALASAAPSLASHAVAISLASVVLLLVANLRGLRESGMVFAIPTYVFVVSMVAMVGIGVVHGLIWGWPHAVVPSPTAVGGAATVSLFVLLRAFASGCSALTGVEAISNGVPAFRAPSARNAGQTLMIMGVIAVFLFMGVSILAWKIGAAPSDQMSVLSQVARTVYAPGSVMSAGFYVIQASTFAVLFLAANASFQGFPRLAALLARDGFAPRQFQNLGDRLVYSNGLAMLSLLACALIVGFNASIDGLIHLYLLGVFIAFTLSQTGMVVRTLRTRDRLTSRVVITRIALNGVGALLTGLVAVITVVTKFSEGAWMVTIAIPVLVAAFLGIRHHYRRVARALDHGYRPSRGVRPGLVVLLVPRIDDASVEGLNYVQSLVGSNFHPLHVSDTGETALARVWQSFGNDYAAGVPALETIRRKGSLHRTVISYVRSLPREDGEYVTVILPSVFHGNARGSRRSRRSALSLHDALMSEPWVAVTDIPVSANEVMAAEPAAARRVEVLVPISGISDASLRAIDYAMSLRGDMARAFYVDLDSDETMQLRQRWTKTHLPMELQILSSPYRELGGPLLREIRKRTANPETICMIVMPELIVSVWWQRFLHNHRADFLKRLLQLEPRVVVTSVPVLLDDALRAEGNRSPTS
ncbi:MAG: APC family permease [Thermoleophilia bacterium]|nr:APC family permease [Thermoleophilia bacterium]